MKEVFIILTVFLFSISTDQKSCRCRCHSKTYY